MTGTGSQRGCAPPPQHLVNLTPHDVVLDLGAGKQLRIPASGVVPRLVLSGGRLETLHVVDPSRPKDSPTATPAGPRRPRPRRAGACHRGTSARLPLGGSSHHLESSRRQAR